MKNHENPYDIQIEKGPFYHLHCVWDGTDSISTCSAERVHVGHLTSRCFKPQEVAQIDHAMREIQNL